MKLSSYTDFALRLLMQLASNPDRLCSINEVARTYQISKNHLMKVAHILVKEGLVKSVRGRNGGLLLARPASCINIAEVIRITESDLAVLDCLQSSTDQSCVIAPACRLKGALARATTAFMEVLEEYSLADCIAENPPLHQLLNLPDAAVAKQTLN